MKEVYFDSNVYTHIHNRQHGITDGDVLKLRAAVKDDKIRILSSTALLEETICTILRSEKEAVALLKLIGTLTKRKRVIKYHFEMLEGTVIAFANGRNEPSPFMAPPANYVRVLRDHSRQHLDWIRQIAEETKVVIDARRNSTDDLYKKIRPLAEEEKEQGKQQSLEDYYEIHRDNLLELFAKHANVLDDCNRLDIRGLMNFKRIQVAVASQLSLGYANTYVRTKIERGDSRDMHHAVLATATGTFVTHDNRFSKVLTRIPVDDFEIIDIHTLLDQVR